MILIAAQQRRSYAWIHSALFVCLLFSFVSKKLKKKKKKKGLSKFGNRGSYGWPEKETEDASLLPPPELLASAVHWLSMLTHNSISGPSHPQRFWTLSSCVSTLPIMAAE